MKDVPTGMVTAWYGGDYTGDKKSMCRITVQQLWALYGGKAVGLDNLYCTVPWGGRGPQVELPNIQKVEIQRSKDNDIDQATITLYNTKPIPIGSIPVMDAPGYYTWRRGQSTFSGRWGDSANTFSSLMVPDNLLRTYEGYGFDASVDPESDPHLVQTGLWMIDEIDYTSNPAIITMTVRDPRRVLDEQANRPPVIRSPYYPLVFTSTQYGGVDPLTGNGIIGAATPKVLTQTTVGAGDAAIANAPALNEPYIQHADGTWTKLTYSKKLPLVYDATSGSNTWFGNTPEGRASGPQAAFDNDDKRSYWRSEGHPSLYVSPPNQPWIQGKMPASYVSRISVGTRHPFEMIYVSLQVNGSWVTHDPTGKALNTIGSLPYIASFQGQNLQPSVGGRLYQYAPVGPFQFDLDLPTPYENVTAIRLSFGMLAAEPIQARQQNGEPWPSDHREWYYHEANGTFGWGPYGLGYWGGANHFHADVYFFHAYGDLVKPGDQLEPPSPADNPRFYNDYTDIIKLFCAWGGYWWPLDAVLIDSQNATHPYAPQHSDYVLGTAGNGRVYGDFEETGTSGPATMDIDVWANKSPLAGIAYVRDIIGFVFLDDGHGGVIWRMPNVYRVGNWLNYTPTTSEFVSPRFGGTTARTDTIITIDERVTLAGLTAKLNSKNVREMVYVANLDGSYAGGSTGFVPNDVNLRRVAGWTDQHFVSDAECAMMADFIAVQQAMSYREDTVTIPGLPAIEVDDQVRIFEEVTAEGYLHYVTGFTSTNDMESGEYTMQLDTFWLGDRPDSDQWGFDLRALNNETLIYLGATNRIDSHVKDWGINSAPKGQPGWAGRSGGQWG